MSADDPKEIGSDAALDDLLLQRLEGLRNNLLDLSNRNRLLSFRHSERARTHIRIIDELPDVLFRRLGEGRRLMFKSLPEPESEPPEERAAPFLRELEAARATHEGYARAMALLHDDELNSRKAAEIERALRDDVREVLGLPPWTDERLIPREDFARQNDLKPDYELPWPKDGGEEAEKHDDGELQTLLFPAEMDRKLSGIVDQARTMLQEAGVNTLYAAFGFLEYYEVGSGERKHLAPLLLMPVQIDRRMSRPWRRYSLFGDGAELEINETLAIRLRNDFGYQLPPFSEEETPESYLRKVSRHISSQARWKVRRFVTVGHFGFSKLPMYNDLSTVMWRETRELEKHRLVRQLLLGAEETDDAVFVAEDYDIDTPEIDGKQLTLIADADASQHSAIVDAVDGRDLVIQGPPGTGKSQTITNMIASLLGQGKSVLFVAEKLAALNVVHARLKQAQLADFCLQVHSNKVPKTSVLNALKRRIDLQNSIEAPEAFAAQIEELHTCRDRLNAYAEHMNTPVGELAMPVQKVLWAERRTRFDSGAGADAIGDLYLEDAAGRSPLDCTQANDAVREMFVRRERIVADHGSLDAHPWAWVVWCESGPFAEEDFRNKAAVWLAALAALGEARDAMVSDYGCARIRDLDELAKLATCLSELPEGPPQPIPALVKVIWEEDLRAAAQNVLDSLASLSSDGAHVSLFEPPGRIPTERSWKRLGEVVHAACDTVFQEAPDAANIAEAETFAAELRDVASLVERTVRIVHAVQEMGGQPVSSAHGEIVKAMKALKLAAALPQDSLVVRSEELRKADAELALKEGMETAASLSQNRDLLEKVFVLRPLPDIYDVSIHARALRGAGVFSIFDSEVKQAKEFFRSIANTSKRVSTGDMGTLFARLEGYLDARRTFENDMRLNALCGNWFKGEGTEFSRFLDLIEWQREVTKVFPQGDPYREMLLGGSYDLLSELRAAAGSLDLETAMDEVGGLAEEVDSIEEEVSHAFAKVNAIDRACIELEDAGVSVTANLKAVLELCEHLRQLDDLRIAARSADETSQQAGLSLGNLREALLFLADVEAMELPGEIRNRLAVRCREMEIARMREHGRDISRLLAEAGQIYSSLYVDGDNQLIEHPPISSVGRDLDELTEKLERGMKAPGALAEWIDYIHSRKRASAGGLGDFLSRLEGADVSVDEATATHEWFVHRSLAREAYKLIPDLSQASGVTIAQLRRKFQNLDRDILGLQQRKLAADLCRRAVAQGNAAGKKSTYSELSLIRHEISKKRRHVPLRDLFGRANEAVQQLKPCFMMSPLSVATYLQPGQIEFDVVIIDEASQMPLEDALGAIARGRQCVVVGDNMQLPPTSFFRRFEDVIDDDAETEDEDLDVESVLDQGMNVFRPPRALRWHYRSQHQSLIAFSNKHFYDNRLTVFPSFREEDKNYGVRLIEVEGQYADRRNLAEVEEVTQWVRERMRADPERTIGIVAVNQLQRDLIRDEMDRIFQEDREAEAYRQKWEDTLHPFFVKNLENVQGDERDIIAISTVYGPNADGRVMQNFGPISHKHGHRRLNVLFTRARQQVVLFSSLTPDDIHIRETTGAGPRVLRDYLEYARTARLDPGWMSDREPESDFEVSVARGLEAYGYDAVPQVGVSGYFVDLGIRHPDFPGHFLLGIECDGATYHSARSARDRDRLREEVLRGQGWILYRVWSTDWFRDPKGEMRKLVAFIEDQAEQRRRKMKLSEQVVEPEPEPPAPEPLEEEPNDEPEADEAVGEAVPPPPAEEMAPAVEGVTPVANAHSGLDPVCAVGDRVVFHYEDTPDERVSATIVIGESDNELGTISRMSPVGDALVGATAGEDVEVYLSDGVRTIIVDEVVKSEQPTLSG